MIIKTVVENLTISEKYKNKHGLCFYIKSNNKNILFDLGPDETFLENAKSLGIDIESIDIVIISHGHSDHGGGLKYFLEKNKKANIYINKNAFGDFYSTVCMGVKKYIGLNKNIENEKRIIYTDDIYKIDENLTLFSNVEMKRFFAKSNNSLLKKEGDIIKKDDFKHEQNLIIKEEEKSILISGCSHCGILNILEKGLKIDNKIKVSIGGLHLCKPLTGKTESMEFIEGLGEEMKKNNIKFYTGHCTGEKPYEILKKILKENINYLKTGSSLNI